MSIFFRRWNCQAIIGGSDHNGNPIEKFACKILCNLIVELFEKQSFIANVSRLVGLVMMKRSINFEDFRQKVDRILPTEKTDFHFLRRILNSLQDFMEEIVDFRLKLRGCEFSVLQKSPHRIWDSVAWW